MKHSTAQVAISESVGTVLEPDHDSMKFAQRSNARMVDVEIYNDVRHKKTQCGIQYVCQSDVVPSSLEVAAVSFVLRSVRGSLAFLPPSNDSFRLLYRSKLDHIRNE